MLLRRLILRLLRTIAYVLKTTVPFQQIYGIIIYCRIQTKLYLQITILLKTFEMTYWVLALYLSQLQKHAPKMVSEVVNFKYEGKLSTFVANEMETLKKPLREPNEPLLEYYARCIPEGNVLSYFSPVKMSVAERLESHITLIGEQPPTENYTRPIYSYRDENICLYELSNDYKAIAQIIYAL